MCAGTCALSALLQTLLWFGVYIWTLFGLRPWVLGPSAAQAGPAASSRLRIIHYIISYPVLLVAFGAGVVVGQALAAPPLAYGLGTLVMVAACNGFNGLFELFTGVCPIYGVIHKRQGRQVFLRHPRVRLLGAARLLVSAVLAVVAALLLTL